MNSPVGERIKALREQRGITQESLADLVGVTQGKISQCETGTRGISFLLGLKIAHALGVSIDDLAPNALEPETNLQPQP